MIIIIAGNKKNEQQQHKHTQHQQKKKKKIKTFKRLFDLRPCRFETFPHVKTQNETRQFSTYPLKQVGGYLNHVQSRFD